LQPQTPSPALNDQDDTPDACRFRFSLLWLADEHCWSFRGGQGYNVHLNSACRRMAKLDKSKSTNRSGEPICLPCSTGRTDVSEGPSDSYSWSHASKHSLAQLAQPTDAECAYEASWVPKELLLPTDSGSVNIAKLMTGERNGSFILMQPVGGLIVNTGEYRRILVQWVQRTCVLSGFAVRCMYPQSDFLPFVCEEAQNCWTRRKKLKKAIAERGTQMSLSEKKLLEQSPCQFQFSLFWLPNDRCWAYKCGRGHAVHKDSACCRKSCSFRSMDQGWTT
jgi:hypothetical protein